MFDGTITEPLRHISLCSGIGGFDIGLRGIFPNMRTVVHVEGEAFCVNHLVEKMQAGQLDACPIYPDLCRFPWSEFAGAVDIITGGFPCQPFSVAGQRKATEDDRHLWPYITDGIRQTKPQLVVFENVSGIASAPSPGFHSVLHNVLSDLERLGYQATAGQFTAAEVGAPHQRKRWFIIGVCNTHCNGKPDGTINAEKPRVCKYRMENTSGHCNPKEFGNFERNKNNRQVLPQNYRQTGSDRFGGTGADGGGYLQWPMPPGPIQYGWEPPRTTEPRLGGNSDGVSNRVDRLRALGNAVVPAVVERAVRELLGRYTTH